MTVHDHESKRFYALTYAIGLLFALLFIMYILLTNEHLVTSIIGLLVSTMVFTYAYIQGATHEK